MFHGTTNMGSFPTTMASIHFLQINWPIIIYFLFVSIGKTRKEKYGYLCKMEDLEKELEKFRKENDEFVGSSFGEIIPKCYIFPLEVR